ncbi:OmpA family protein [Phenylobacterium sp.]|uniref:OmpA family protein n=1 Tax=Phenylobacterium sp. TaxID=1871053 RepID=UPI00286B1770|nr:OmpA family protein [Phenylobacterium sp.]
MSIHRSAILAILTLGLGLGACATLKPGRYRPAETAQRCADQKVAVYFESESAEIGRESRAVISAAATASRSCRVASVEVVGLADATGAADANLELSKRRAASVTAALAAAGLPTTDVKITAGGQAGATTADGHSAPLRRRADVVMHLVPR